VIKALDSLTAQLPILSRVRTNYWRLELPTINWTKLTALSDNIQDVLFDFTVNISLEQQEAIIAYYKKFDWDNKNSTAWDNAGKFFEGKVNDIRLRTAYIAILLLTQRDVPAFLIF